MAHPNAPPKKDWVGELDDLLERAAKLAADHDLDHSTFIQSAWAKCLEARPGLRAALEDKQWRAELKKLRKRGLVGSA